MKKIIFITLALVILVGCGSDNNETTSKGLENFKNEPTTGAYVNGEAIIKFNEDIHQVAINSGKGIFRIQTDSQDKYLNCTLTPKPTTKGETVLVTVVTHGTTAMAPSYTMKAEKFEGKKIWLWDEATTTGFIVEF